MLEHSYLDAIPLFPKHRISLTAHMKIDPSQSHQITFIRSVNEHFSLIRFSRKHSNRLYFSILLFDAFRTSIKPFISENLNTKFLRIIFKNLFRRMWFKNPHRPIGPIHRHSSLTFIAIFRFFLPHPIRIFLIMLINTLVKIPR